MPDTTRQLTSAIASGDSEAFARFYRQWFDVMYAEARKATKRDEAFCLDVVQDSMMKVIRRVPAIDSEAALAVWLRRVVQSCAYDALRREVRRGRRERSAGSSPRHAASGVDQEQLEWLAQELSSLDDESARLIHLRHRLGWTLAKIGAAVGLSTGAVDGRLARAMRLLRRKAKEQFDE